MWIRRWVHVMKFSIDVFPAVKAWEVIRKSADNHSRMLPLHLSCSLSFPEVSWRFPTLPPMSVQGQHFLEPLTYPAPSRTKVSVPLWPGLGLVSGLLGGPTALVLVQGAVFPAAPSYLCHPFDVSFSNVLFLIKPKPWHMCACEGTGGTGGWMVAHMVSALQLWRGVRKGSSFSWDHKSEQKEDVQ